MASSEAGRAKVTVEIEFTADVEQKIRELAALEIDKRLQQLHLAPVDLTAEQRSL